MMALSGFGSNDDKQLSVLYKFTTPVLDLKHGANIQYLSQVLGQTGLSKQCKSRSDASECDI